MNRLLFAPILEAPIASPLLTPSDIEFIEGMASARRRREVTVWRSLLREALVAGGYESDSKCEICYDANRAPYLADSKIHIGVSHSRTMVAVIVSTAPCAIDIEDYERDFAIVAKRFTTAEEMSIIDVSDERMILPILWSAKETLYKISRRTGLDLIRDLMIVGQRGDRLQCLICGTEPHELRFTIRDGHIVVHTA